MSCITDHCCQGQTLVDRIKLLGETDGETPAFIFWSEARRRQLSRAQVLDLSSRFASRLKQHGVLPGEVVCICLPNCPERVVAEFGVQLAGAVSMNGQLLRADGEDFISSLQKSKCSFLILNVNTDQNPWNVCKQMFEEFEEFEDSVVLKSEKVPHMRKVFFIKDNFLQTLGPEKFEREASGPDDVVSIFTTSGSTGYSKLVTHTSASLLTYSHTISQILHLGPNLGYFNCSPLGWVGGFPAQYLYSGCTRVAIDEFFGSVPDRMALIWSVICREKIPVAYMVPSFMMQVHEQRLTSGLGHRMTSIVSGGQPVKKPYFRVLGQLTDALTVVYGSTELFLVSRRRFDLDSKEQLDNMTGLVYEGVDVKIVNRGLNPTPTESRGEIVVRSPTLCKGYLGADTSSLSSFLPGGWFRTGDVGYLREDGCLFVEGRSSDAIMHGSYILYPGWLEQQLTLCPGVAEAVIVPVPDPLLHHEICACVKIDTSVNNKTTTEDIINFCKKQLVLEEESSLNVVPKYVLFFQEFPQTSTYKLSRRLVADMARRQLNL